VVEGSQHAQRDAQHKAENHCENADLHRDGQAAPDDVADRLAQRRAPQRRPEVQAGQAAQVADELGHQRLVQAVLAVEAVDHALWHPPPFPHHVKRPARRRPDHHEGHKDNQEQDGQGHDDAPDQKLPHAHGSSLSSTRQL